MIIHRSVPTRGGLTLHSSTRHFQRCFHATRKKRWTYDNLPDGQPPPGMPAPGTHAPEHYFPLYSRNFLAHRRWEKKHNRPNLVPGLLPYDPTDKWADQNHSSTLLLAAQTLRAALRSGEPHAVLRSLIRLSFQADKTTLTGILTSMPANTFSEVLRCLDPKHFLHHYQRLHENISPTNSRLLSLPKVDAISYHKFSSIFLSLIKEVVAARRQSHPFTAINLRYTLRCARGVGDLRYAEDVWWALTTSGKGCLAPDIDCYNDLLGVICWSDTLNPVRRHRLRNIRWNFAPRSWVTPPVDLESSYRVRENGIGNRVQALFNEMVTSGQRGNEETFCHMIIGFGREWDFAAVESILKRVWNIDVQELLKYKPHSELSARTYPPDSPFYPSQQLIYSIAHCYGSNNQVPTALAILDFISSQYSVKPNKDAWHELLRWAYTLSRPTSRPPRRAYKNNPVTMNSSIPSESVMNLWKTMVSEPYNVKPSIEMYDLVVRSALSVRKLRYAEELMEEGRACHKKDVFKLGYIMKRIGKAQKDSQYYEKLARTAHFQQLQIRINRLTIRRWVKLLLSVPHSSSLHKKLSWFARAVPRLVGSWISFVPYRIDYPTATGRVSFWSGTFELNRERVWRLRYGTEQGWARKGKRRTRISSGVNIVELAPKWDGHSGRSSRRKHKTTSLERRRKQRRKNRIVVQIKIPELSLPRRKSTSFDWSPALWKAALSITKPSCVAKERLRELRMWLRYQKLRPRLLERWKGKLVRQVNARPPRVSGAKRQWIEKQEGNVVRKVGVPAEKGYFRRMRWIEVRNFGVPAKKYFRRMRWIKKQEREGKVAPVKRG